MLPRGMTECAISPAKYIMYFRQIVRKCERPLLKLISYTDCMFAIQFPLFSEHCHSSSIKPMSDTSLPLSNGSFCTSTVKVFSTNEPRVLYTIELTWLIATIWKATNSQRFSAPIMNILSTTYSRNARIFDPTYIQIYWMLKLYNSKIWWRIEKIYIYLPPKLKKWKNTITKMLKRMDRAIRLRLVSWECLYTPAAIHSRPFWPHTCVCVCVSHHSILL